MKQIPPRPMDRQRVGRNDPPLAATPNERARFLRVLEEFEISFEPASLLFSVFYKGKGGERCTYLGGTLAPEEAI